MEDAWLSTWLDDSESHLFDPDGDVLLVLERSLPEPRVEIPVPADEVPHESPREWLDLESDVLADEKLEPAQKWFEPEAESGLELRSDEVQAEGSTSAFHSSKDSKPVNANVVMRVSSKHLILASTTFRLSLGSDTYAEGRLLRANGHIIIPLPDEDPDAMIVLMNIIHGRSNKVSRQVYLEMLYRIAVVVNHRQMHDSVELWSDTWIINLKKDEGLPESYVPEKLLRWLFIFWVFRKGEDFGKMALILERESDGTLEHEVETICPQIPASVINAISARREEAIESMITIVHDYIDKYSTADIICDHRQEFSCDAKILGSLWKSAAMVGIMPPPMKPYSGITREALSDKIREMQVLEGCKNNRSGYYGSAESHGIKEVIEASISSLEQGSLGLQLTSVLPKKGRTTKGKKKKGKTFLKD